MKEINLKKCFEDGALELEDSTFYNINSNGYILEFSNEFLKNNVINWVNEEDLLNDNEEIILDDEEYDNRNQEETTVLLIGRYVGMLKVKITYDGTSKEVTWNIKSRFDSICIDTMLNSCTTQWDEWCDDKTNKGKSRIKVEGYELVDISALYEVYVRTRIRECLKENSELELVEAACKVVCPQKKCSWIPTGQGNNKIVDKVPTDNNNVYISGEVIPDIILKSKNSEDYIIYDVKYKRGIYNQGTRSDRLQILAYAYMWKCRYIGHIFPENEKENPLIIPCESGVELWYNEFKCNTRDGMQVLEKHLAKLQKEGVVNARKEKI